jgi:hypothetical protein
MALGSATAHDVNIQRNAVTVATFGASAITLATDIDIVFAGTGAATTRTNLGLGTAATQNIGTSGATIPFLNGNNTYSGTSAFSGETNFAAGITFTDTVAANAQDLTDHIRLHSSGLGYGFNITSGTLNYNSGGSHNFYSGSTLLFSTNTTGFGLASNMEISFAGTGAAGTKTNLGIKKYQSSNQTITLGGLISLTHSLGVEPDIVQLWAECIVANNGFSVGEAALLPANSYDGSSDIGCTMTKTSTQIHIRTADVRFIVGMINPDTGTSFIPDPADFNYRVIAYTI